MQAGVAVAVSRVYVRPQLDQSLHVFDVHRDGRKVEGRGALVVSMSDADCMTACEDKDREDAFVPLCRAVHDILVVVRILVRVTLELKHQHLDHVPVPSRRSQVDGLGSHMRVAMLSHCSLRDLIIGELVPHRVQDQVRLLEADKLQHVHIVVEAQVKILFLLDVEEAERLHIISLYVELDPGDALGLLRHGISVDGGDPHRCIGLCVQALRCYRGVGQAAHAHTQRVSLIL